MMVRPLLTLLCLFFVISADAQPLPLVQMRQDRLELAA